MAVVETCRSVAFPWLVDEMGHLSTSKHVEMFDVASRHLNHALGDRPERGDGFGWADVRHVIDYKAEVGVGGLLLIRSGIVEVGRSSYRARHVMTDPGGDTVYAVLEATTVRFDLARRKSVNLPDWFIAHAAVLGVEPA